MGFEVSMLRFVEEEATDCKLFMVGFIVVVGNTVHISDTALTRLTRVQSCDIEPRGAISTTVQ